MPIKKTSAQSIPIQQNGKKIPVTKKKMSFQKKQFITSISGWRKIFSYQDSLHTHDKNLIIKIALSWVHYMHKGPTRLTLLGRDSRPSGALIQDIFMESFSQYHLEFFDLGIIAGPHLMAISRNINMPFIYITASHNPPEYNGIKFGSAQGGVLKEKEYKELLDIFESMPLLLSDALATYTHIQNKKTKGNKLKNAPKIHSDQRTKAFYRSLISTKYYDTLLQTVYSGMGTSALKIKKAIQKTLTDKDSLHVILDANGGARALNFDSDFLQSLKINVIQINTLLGIFTHQIIPEGSALVQIIQEMKKNPQIALGITFDCDGDRGNIALRINDAVALLVPQDLFCMCVLIELKWRRIFGTKDNRYCLIVNDASTIALDEICTREKISLFRTEVGEANVVKAMEEAQKKGYTVLLAGEASNGGVIFSPFRVRDPFVTLLILLKALLWPQKLGLGNTAQESFEYLLSAIPQKQITNTEDKKAKILYPQGLDFAKCYQSLIRHIQHRIEDIQAMLIPETITNNHLSITKKGRTTNTLSSQSNSLIMQFFIYSNTKKIAVTPRTSVHSYSKGGLSVIIKNKKTNSLLAKLWIRPSGTEALVRIIVEVLNGNKKQYTTLLQLWHEAVNKAIHDTK